MSKKQTKQLFECNECFIGTYNFEEHYRKTKHIAYSKLKNSDEHYVESFEIIKERLKYD